MPTGAPGLRLPAIVIDTFENNMVTDAIVQPQDPRFQPWQFYDYNDASTSTVSSQIVTPGDDSNYAIDLVWQVFDPPDGQENDPGVGLQTPAVSYVDLSGYSRFLFAQQYSHVDDCMPVTNLRIYFGCSEYNASFNATVPLSYQWTTTTIPFASFVQAASSNPAPTAWEDCAKVIDGFGFQADSLIGDGDCASGDLLIDNVSIR